MNPVSGVAIPADAEQLTADGGISHPERLLVGSRCEPDDMVHTRSSRVS